MSDEFPDISGEDIRPRDKYQFELKLEYTPPIEEENCYSQEFYFFIPDALHMGPSTYDRREFYQDQTCLIRYKTPEFKLKELVDPDLETSPMNRVRHLLDREKVEELWPKILEEAKLFANAYRSSLRNRTRDLQAKIASARETVEVQLINQQTQELHQDIRAVRKLFSDYLDEVCKRFEDDEEAIQHMAYLDEFQSLITEINMTNLLHSLRQGTADTETDELLCRLLRDEQTLRHEKGYHSPLALDEQGQREYRTYRKGLLKKYVLDVLRLKTERKVIVKQATPYIAGVAAGIAMLMYMVLFVWGANALVMNSTPFVLATVVFYILKDRLKEGIKTFFFDTAGRWFPDYRTDILTGDTEKPIGTLTETFAWLGKRQIPQRIARLRNRGFHTEIERAKRQETVFRYKMDVRLFGDAFRHRRRLRKLNSIFRYNIHQFLIKASDAYHTHHYYNSETDELEEITYPKVYHVNIIMHNIYQPAEGEAVDEMRKFRLIVDKEGIKRIEKVH